MIRTVCHMGMLYLIREWQPAEQTLTIRVYQASTKPAARSASVSRPPRPLRARLKKAKQQRLFCRRCFFPAFPHDACLPSPKKRKKETHVLRAKRIVTVTECTLQFFERKRKEKHEKDVQRSKGSDKFFSHFSNVFESFKFIHNSMPSTKEVERFLCEN